MASLERCADALLQQKAVQSSHHEHLGQQVLDLERARRSSLVVLRGLMASVQRCTADLLEVSNTGRLHTEQLAQEKLKLSALTIAIAEDKKLHAEVEGRLAWITEKWVGQPTRIVQVVRALQERSGMVREVETMAAALRSAQDVVRCISRAGQLRRWASSRLTLQRAHLPIFHEAAEKRIDATRQAIAQSHATLTDTQQRQRDVRRRLTDGGAELLLLDAAAALNADYVEALSQRALLCRAAVAAATDHADRQAQCLEKCREGCRRVEEEHQRALEEAAAAEAARRSQADMYSLQRTALEKEEQRAKAAQAMIEVKCGELEQSLALRQRSIDDCSRQALCVARLLALWQRWRRAQQTDAAAQALAASGAMAALAVLRERHEAHLSHQRAVRQQQRLREAVSGLGAEESLTRRREIADKEADDYLRLQAYHSAALAHCKASDRQRRAHTGPTGGSLTPGDSREARRERRVPLKRCRRAAGAGPDLSNEASTLADELGLDAAMAQPASGAKDAARRPHSFGSGYSQPVASQCRIAARFPVVWKESASGGSAVGALALLGHRGRDGTTPKKAKLEPPRPHQRRRRGLLAAADLSDLSSPSPRKPAALTTRVAAPLPVPPGTAAATHTNYGSRSSTAGGASSTSAVQAAVASRLRQHGVGARAALTGNRQPLVRRGAAAAALVGLGGALLSPQSPNPQRERTALKPTAVRPAQCAALLVDNGEDLFADIFS